MSEHDIGCEPRTGVCLCGHNKYGGVVALLFYMAWAALALAVLS